MWISKHFYWNKTYFQGNKSKYVTSQVKSHPISKGGENTSKDKEDNMIIYDEGNARPSTEWYSLTITQ